MTATPTRTQDDVRQPLAETLVALAGTPDDVPGVDEHLATLARLAAGRIAAVDYAAVTRQPGDRCTLATSGGLVDAVEDAAPDPLRSGAVPATIEWPRFAETAERMGLSAASVPLFTGSGAEIATLDLYGRDATALGSLTAGVCAAYDPDLPLPGEDGIPPLDAGGEELIAGFMEALSVRATIQFALSVLMTSSVLEAGDAYANLRLQAAERGVSLLDAATSVVGR